MEKLLIATNNRGKVREIEKLIAGMPVKLVTLRDLAIDDEIEETADTFLGNANLKAAGYAKLTKLPTLADDSGLVVDRLGGRPGILSARYAGENASDRDRILKLLDEMKDAPQDERSARFSCAIALANSNGDIAACVEGSCEGRLSRKALGEGGFGYDPIFVPLGFDQTFGELDAEVKNRISHRAVTVTKIIPFLRGFFEI